MDIWCRSRRGGKENDPHTHDKIRDLVERCPCAGPYGGSDEPSSGTASTATDAPVPAAATAPPAASGSAETDREALVALYNATNGENWTISDKWLSDAPFGEWHGVTTNGDGRVVELDLSFNALSGEIRPELGSLSNLEWLRLGNFELSGEIPPELGSLSNLELLSLSGNFELSGEIPAELGSLSNLTELYLNNNDLSGEIPAELGSLSNLTELLLYGNELSGCVPSSLEDQSRKIIGPPFC